MFLLYNPASTSAPRKPLPMSLLAAASRLECEVRIVDGNLEADPLESLVDASRSRRPRAIGVTVMPGPQLQHAVADTRRLKAAFPGVPIVWGGYFPSQHAETCLRDEAVDFCVRGQAELVLPELERLLRDGGDPAAIPGLSWKRDGTVHHNPTRPLVPLDELPDWPYERLPSLEPYLHRHYLGRRVAAHQSSYGCPFTCGFCGIVPIAQGRWVAQSPARVEAVMRWFHERHGADAIQFHDMDFFVSRDRVLEIAERVRPLGMRWWALGRVDELARYGDDQLNRLRESGLKMVFCGAESGSDEALEQMGKGGRLTAAMTLDVVARLREHGIVPELSFVLGLPPEPARDVESTLAFVRRVKEVNPEAEIILYLYTPVPLDGALSAAAASQGFGYPETLDGWISGDWRAFSLRRDPPNPWLDPALKRRVRDFESVLNAWYPTVTDERLHGLRRTALRALAGWRYRTATYRFPWELQAFHRLVGYRRPETAGF